MKKGCKRMAASPEALTDAGGHSENGMGRAFFQDPGAKKHSGTARRVGIEDN
jgi:hypothetical protein